VDGVGALEAWFGWLPEHYSPFRGFHAGVLALTLLALGAALLALRVFRFPLLVLLIAAATWFFIADLVSNGGNWTAVVTLLVGFGFLAAAVRADGRPARADGFWLHVAAGLTVGGALIWFWHTSDANWALVAATGVVVRCSGSRSSLSASCWHGTAGPSRLLPSNMGAPCRGTASGTPSATRRVQPTSAAASSSPS
jgi:hypothetical protein